MFSERYLFTHLCVHTPGVTQGGGGMTDSAMVGMSGPGAGAGGMAGADAKKETKSDVGSKSEVVDKWDPNAEPSMHTKVESEDEDLREALDEEDQGKK